MALAAERRTIEGSDDARGDAGGCVAPPAAASEASSPPARAGGRREAPTLDLSIEHISTTPARTAPFYGSIATTFVAANAASWKLIQGGKP